MNTNKPLEHFKTVASDKYTLFMTLQYSLFQQCLQEVKNEGKEEGAAFPVFYPLVLCLVWSVVNTGKIASVFLSQEPMRVVC